MVMYIHSLRDSAWERGPSGTARGRNIQIVDVLLHKSFLELEFAFAIFTGPTLGSLTLIVLNLT